MALPGLLVEYLVVGSMALLWALPLAGLNLDGEIPVGSAAALAPAIYVLGMFIDFAAFILVSKIPTRDYSLKALVRWWVHEKPDIEVSDKNPFAGKFGRSSRGLIWLSQYSPDLAREVRERSSRDRVARGVMVNILLIWLASKSVGESAPIIIPDTSWILILTFSLCVWLFLETHSYSFEIRAGELIDTGEHAPEAK